tara:strand:+ start:833 stop:1138 length:306 start_codon:yes stop_codon:yes gene_type:complete
MIIFNISLATIIAGIMAAAATMAQPVYPYDPLCGYNVHTGYYVSGGQQFAYGTMDAAYGCAVNGSLPDFVKQRLAEYGDKDAKSMAEEIKEVNVEKNKVDK